MKGVLAGMLLGVLALSQAHAAPPRPLPFPRELQGVWFTADGEGRRMCRDYLRPARRVDVDDDWMRVLGGIVVTPYLLHQVSEYGEGNFYAVERIASRRAGEWLVHARVGIDTLPSEGEPGDVAVLQFARSPQGLLRWRERHPGAAPHEAGPYFRCDARAPAGWGVR